MLHYNHWGDIIHCLAVVCAPWFIKNNKINQLFITPHNLVLSGKIHKIFASILGPNLTCFVLYNRRPHFRPVANLQSLFSVPCMPWYSLNFHFWKWWSSQYGSKISATLASSGKWSETATATTLKWIQRLEHSWLQRGSSLIENDYLHSEPKGLQLISSAVWRVHRQPTCAKFKKNK